MVAAVRISLATAPPDGGFGPEERGLADYFETQSDDGSWRLAGTHQNDVTAEMVVWLDEIDQAV